MKTMTRMNAFALFAIAAVALGVATWEAETGNPQTSVRAASTALVAPSLTGTVDTGWLPAAEARREIEELGAVLDRLAVERGFGVRILDSNTQLRTRTADGTRLDVPLARFERSFEFRVPESGDLESLRNALATLAVEVEPSATVIDAHYAERRNTVGF